MRVYLDACCLSRLTDDQSQAHVRAEAGAVERIMRMVRQGVARWVSSTVLNVEAGRNPDYARRREAEALLSFADELLVPEIADANRAREIELISEYVSAFPRNAGRLLLMLAGCVLLAGTGKAQSVKVDFDRHFDFSKLRRYQWRTHPIFETHPELRDRYSTAIQLVMNATNEQLMKKGYRPVSSAPDVFLTFFVSSKEVKNTYTDMVGPLGPAYGWYGWYAPPVWTVTRTEQYLEGTLVMDMVEPNASTLIWRASATDAILDFRTRDKNIYAAVKKILGKFPPKQKKPQPS